MCVCAADWYCYSLAFLTKKSFSQKWAQSLEVLMVVMVVKVEVFVECTSGAKSESNRMRPWRSKSILSHFVSTFEEHTVTKSERDFVSLCQLLKVSDAVLGRIGSQVDTKQTKKMMTFGGRIMDDVQFAADVASPASPPPPPPLLKISVTSICPLPALAPFVPLLFCSALQPPSVRRRSQMAPVDGCTDGRRHDEDCFGGGSHSGDGHDELVPQGPFRESFLMKLIMMMLNRLSPPWPQSSRGGPWVRYRPSRPVLL